MPIDNSSLMSLKYNVSVKRQKLTHCLWANLTPDMLTTIVDRLDITNSMRLPSICTSWASTLCPYLPTFPPFRRDKPIPWLLLSAHNLETDTNRTELTFYDLVTTTSYYIPTPIPSISDHNCWAPTRDGW